MEKTKYNWGDVLAKEPPELDNMEHLKLRRAAASWQECVTAEAYHDFDVGEHPIYDEATYYLGIDFYNAILDLNWERARQLRETLRDRLRS